MIDDAGGPQLDDLVLADLERVAGVGDEGGDVAGQERFAVAQADDERRIAPGGDDGVRIGGARDDEREGAGQRAADLAQRRGQGRRTGGEALLEQVGDDLGVGVAGEGVTAQLELGCAARRSSR